MGVLLDGGVSGVGGPRGGGGGGWYDSVGFFEEFIGRGGAGERVLVAVRVVGLEQLVESRGYVGHWRCLGIAG